MEIRVSLKERLFLLFTSFIALTLFSKSSFLYPFNNWVDANCYFTVGKSILNGLVPYKDLVDHKGILLYFIQMAGALISYTSFFGVYLLEIVASYLFLFYSYKGIRYYTNSQVIILFPFIAFIIYSSVAFGNGDSAEEFCIPFLAHAFYLGLKFIEGKTHIDKYSYILMGIGMSCVFWIKFNLVGFYIGLFLFILVSLLLEKNYKQISGNIIRVVIGFMIITLPIIAYALFTDSISDLYEIYFYKNIFSYNRSGVEETSVLSLFLHVCGRMKYGIVTNPILTTLIAFAIIGFLKKSKHLLLIICTLATTSFSFCLSKTFDYYFFMWSLFVPYSLILLNNLLNRIIVPYPIKYTVVSLLTLFFGAVSFKTSPNTYMLLQEQSQFPQYQFKQIICKEHNPTVLNKTMDIGVYTVTGIIPSCRYFCSINIDKEQIAQEHQTIIDNKKVDFIVARGIPLQTNSYKLVKSVKGDNGMGDNTWFYLYRRE